jgi:hypothetical protein
VTRTLLLINGLAADVFALRVPEPGSPAVVALGTVAALGARRRFARARACST